MEAFVVSLRYCGESLSDYWALGTSYGVVQINLRMRPMKAKSVRVHGYVACSSSLSDLASKAVINTAPLSVTKLHVVYLTDPIAIIK